MNCCGKDAVDRATVLEVTFDETIDSVASRRRSRPTSTWRPGWIDLQVNGFAGVDYNDPAHAARRDRALDPGAVLDRRDALLSRP